MGSERDTPDIPEFCVVKKSGPKWLAAVIDDAEKNPLVNRLVLFAFNENIALIANIPNFFAQFERPCPCTDGMCVPRFDTLVRIQPSFFVPEGSVHFGFDSSALFVVCVTNLLLSTFRFREHPGFLHFPG